MSLLNLVTNVIWQLDIPYRHTRPASLHVDLGAGDNPRNPFLAQELIITDFNDVRDHRNFIKCDITRNLPFANSSIDSFSAYDVLEHIPRWERVRLENDTEIIIFPFINLMNEVFRALKPGGLFYAVTPALPSLVAFQDPTHINFITEETKNYFTGPSPIAKILGYGFEGSFNVIAHVWIRRHKGGLGRNSGELPSCLGGSEIYRYLLQKKNLRAVLSLILRWRQRKPTHLLWVFEKPHSG